MIPDRSATMFQEGIERGAERERKRIRRAQAQALALLEDHVINDGLLDLVRYVGSVTKKPKRR